MLLPASTDVPWSLAAASSPGGRMEAATSPAVMQLPRAILVSQQVQSTVWDEVMQYNTHILYLYQE